MSLVPEGKAVEPISLIRSPSSTLALTSLDRAGRKLACGLADTFSGLMSVPASATTLEVRTGPASLSAERAYCSIRLAPSGAIVTIGMARAALMALVDRYYGGTGTGLALRDQLSPAEARFFRRVGAAICQLLPASWQPQAMTAELLDEVVELNGPVTSQSFQLSCNDWPPFELDCGYPESFLKAVADLGSAPSNSGSGADNGEWQQQLMEGALNVPFPAAVVLAEPEVTLSELVSLRPGDVIPLTITGLSSLTVSGTTIAFGNVGESNGRAALRVDQV